MTLCELSGAGNPSIPMECAPFDLGPNRKVDTENLPSTQPCVEYVAGPAQPQRSFHHFHSAPFSEVLNIGRAIPAFIVKCVRFVAILAHISRLISIRSI